MVETSDLDRKPHKNMQRLTLRRSLTVASWLVICTSCSILSGCNILKPPTEPGAIGSGNAGGPPGNPPPGGGADNARPERQGSNPLQLLQHPLVKSELKLTNEQVAKIKAIESDLTAKVTTSSESIKNKYKSLETLPKDRQDSEKKQLAVEIEQSTTTIARESQQQVNQVLTPAQTKRAKEILLQKYDFGILTKDDFATDLKLTEAQKKQLNDIVGQMRIKTIGAWEIPDREDATKREKTLANNRKRMEAVMKESNQQAKAVLTPDQLKTLETLRGKAVSFPLADLK
jgi:Spy/CpxP family protein refolding chaperone